jgi:hypothetical protein
LASDLTLTYLQIAKILGVIMKKALTLISILFSILGIITTGIVVSIGKPASAYCVYNKAAFSVLGVDTRKGAWDGYWENSLAPGDKDCCPGKNEECQNAKIRVTGEQNSSCEASVDAHGWIVVHSTSTPNGLRLDCNVNEPI